MMNYLGGVGKGESYFTQLKSNGLIIHRTNDPTLQALASVKTQSINPYTWGPQEATINTWFDGSIVR
jgi:hypothetical protein